MIFENQKLQTHFKIENCTRMLEMNELGRSNAQNATNTLDTICFGVYDTLYTTPWLRSHFANTCPTDKRKEKMTIMEFAHEKINPN